jgi:LmbE family N-acetylglucosaminyl deacetylase
MRSCFHHVSPALTALPLALLLTATRAGAQERGAALRDQLVRGLTVSARVLVIGAYPGDEDHQLIAFLSRGRGIETGYLSLTRGDGGRNSVGGEGGETLGAVRTEELLAARRVDGARQFFTRAYDFGFARNAKAAFERWPRDELVADIVAVIRSFRPHVVVTLHDTVASRFSSGVRQAAAELAYEAFHASGDTARFAGFGAPWSPAALFGRVPGPAPPVPGYDPVAGDAYTALAQRSASFHRSQITPGTRMVGGSGGNVETLVLAAPQAPATPPRRGDLFALSDTTFGRLATGAPATVAASLPHIGAWADSVRRELDLRRPWLVVRSLAELVRHVDAARQAAPSCGHPAVDALVAPLRVVPDCDEAALDLDASLDVVRRRAIDALLAAAGVRFEITARKELLAYGEMMPMSVAVFNHGREPLSLLDVRFTGVASGRAMPVVIVKPDSVVRWTQFVGGLPDAHPSWLGRRLQDLFPPTRSPIDGLARVGSPGAIATLPGVAVPADFRRTSDLTVTLSLAGSTFSTSLGPVIHRSADPLLGVQERPVGGVPAVTLEFDQNLQWFAADKPITRVVSLTMQSHSDSARTFSFDIVAPAGLRIDSLPDSVTLAPGERRELLLRLRGSLTPGRHEFGVIGTTGDGMKFAEGFRTVQYAHIRPVRMFRSSGMYLQSVAIAVPRNLSVAYIRGVADAGASYLRQLGVSVTELDAAEFPLLDLTRYSTLVIGPRAFEFRPQLLAYSDRMTDFARRGGTLVVQHSEMTSSLQRVLPFPLGWNLPPERVATAGAPVAVLDPRSRILSWPNRIGAADWRGWVQERALFMPTMIDARYATPLEMHDPGQRENRGAVLVGPVGKGLVVYTTLALFRQLPGGVPGGARLLVNLVSAGVPRVPVR